MKNNPIGLFDSGVGGLTVLRALKDVLPHERFVYLGDTARLPYGTKSEETIIKYALQCTAKLMQHDLKMLVVACNTVSSVALPSLQKAYPHIDVLGVVEPGAKAACLATKNNYIAILGTQSTIRGGAYENAIHLIKKEVKTIAKATPLFVGMAEEGLVQGKLVEDIATHYLKNIFHLDTNIAMDNSNILPDTLVLGCTHFPLLKVAIKNILGESVSLVDSAQTTAAAVHALLCEHKLVSDKQNQSFRFLTTDDVQKFAQIGENFLGFPLSYVELVDL